MPKRSNLPCFLMSAEWVKDAERALPLAIRWMLVRFHQHQLEYGPCPKTRQDLRLYCGNPASFSTQIYDKLVSVLPVLSPTSWGFKEVEDGVYKAARTSEKQAERGRKRWQGSNPPSGHLPTLERKARGVAAAKPGLSNTNIKREGRVPRPVSPAFATRPAGPEPLGASSGASSASMPASSAPAVSTPLLGWERELLCTNCRGKHFRQDVADLAEPMGKCPTCRRVGELLKVREVA
jgi:hypothetical protein